MKYLPLLLLLTACGSPRHYAAPNYSSIQLPNNGVTVPYGTVPICHGQMVGGICTGPLF